MPTSSTIDSEQPGLLGRPIAFRLTEDERDRLVRLARYNDRVPGAEVRRAVRYYLSHFDIVDRALRERAFNREQAGATR